MKFIDTDTGADFDVETFEDLKHFTERNMEGYIMIGRRWIPIKITVGKQTFPFED